MPTMLVQALRSWGGTQESVTSLAGGEVTFQPRVAMRVGTRVADKNANPLVLKGSLAGKLRTAPILVYILVYMHVDSTPQN